MLHVAFVRAVMVGREGLHRQVLTEAFEAAGGRNARSYISTGNVSFDLAPNRLDRAVSRIESTLSDVAGRPVELILRTLDELVAMLRSDPFSASPYDAPRHRIITFFRHPVDGAAVPIVSATDDMTVFAATDRELFTVTRQLGDRHPGAPGALLERLTGQRATSRVLPTVERIVGSLTAA